MNDAQKAIEAKRRSDVIAFKRCFTGNAEGERVLAYLSSFCMEKRTTYTTGDPNHTAFNEGARTVILEIRRMTEMNMDEPKPQTAVTQESK